MESKDCGFALKKKTYYFLLLLLIGEIRRGSRNNSTSCISLVYFHWPCFIAWKGSCRNVVQEQESQSHIHTSSVLADIVSLRIFASVYYELLVFNLV